MIEPRDDAASRPDALLEMIRGVRLADATYNASSAPVHDGPENKAYLEAYRRLREAPPATTIEGAVDALRFLHKESEHSVDDELTHSLTGAALAFFDAGIPRRPASARPARRIAESKLLRMVQAMETPVADAAMQALVCVELAQAVIQFDGPDDARRATVMPWQFDLLMYALHLCESISSKVQDNWEKLNEEAFNAEKRGGQNG